jgi:hypothetical protein
MLPAALPVQTENAGASTVNPISPTADATRALPRMRRLPSENAVTAQARLGSPRA